MKYCWALLLFLSSLLSFGQQYNLINYSVDEGLPSSQVTSINQDQDGYLWIGTETGLSKFDGLEFVNFSVADGLTDNKIEEILVRGRDIWVGTRKGISHYENQEFKPYTFDEEIRVNDLLFLDEELLIAHDQGIIKFNKGLFEPYFLDKISLKIRSLAFLNGVLYLGTPEGLFKFSNEELIRFDEPELDVNISDLEVSNDFLYISTYGDAVLTLNPMNNAVEVVSDRLSSIREIHVVGNTIISSTKNGAIIKGPSQDHFINDQNGLEVEQVKCSYLDSEGNFWIGSDGGGLVKFGGDAIVSFGVKDGLSSNAVMSISTHNDVHLFGTYNAGLTIYGRDIEIVNEGNGLIDNRIWCVESHFNKIFLGTDDGVSFIDEDGKYSSLQDQFLNHKIRTILRVDSTIYFGGTKGIFILGHGEVKPRANTQDLNINKLVLHNDEVYIGANTGLFKIDKTSGIIENIALPTNDVNTVLSDSRGYLWVGTQNGLYVLDGDLMFPIELDKNEFKSRQILGLLETKNRTVWVSTAFGVYNIGTTIFNRHEQLLIRQFGKVEGIVNLECNLNAIYEDSDGFVWVGTSTGLCKIDPEKSDQLFELKSPRVQFTNLRLFLEEFDFDKFTKEPDSLGLMPKQISLPYNKNHITFDFMGLNLKDPFSVSYDYRMIGLNDNWISNQKDNYVTYSFLSPGEYTFQVRASNKNFEKSSIIEMGIIINPPFWRTWWFLVIMIGLIVLLLWQFFRARLRNLEREQRNEKLEFKNRLQLLEQRSLNASMNRHFIFNSLNSIQYYINSSDKRSANKYLTSFAKLIRMNLDSSVQHNFIVSLEEEIQRIELYLNLEKMRFNEKFNYELVVDSELDLEGIQIPSMILQPFAENALIHGILPLDRPGKITINIYEEEGELVFEVVDDGIGIDKSLEMKCVEPSGDHESQGVEITNRRIEILRRITGDKLLIIGPKQLSDPEGNCLGTKVVIKMPLGLAQNI
ncbi:MAG: histidine kinase [Crocinitomicaceae bacterium]|nr:histidine kinase [Crocinitomicaceae bacterium]